jgi:hypothetical protein
MARNALKKIVKAVASTKKVKPVFVNHPYFHHCEEKDWEGMDTFFGGVLGPGYYDRLKKAQNVPSKKKK